MKRIVFLVGLMLVLNGIFVYGQENKSETKSEAQKVDWIDRYENAFKTGDVKGVFEAYGNIIKQKIEDVALDRLLAIAKDKTMTSEGGIDFRTMTIELIGKLKDERAFNGLKNIAEDKEQVDVIRTYAIQRMTDTSKDRKVFDYLVSKLNDPVPMIRTGAVNGLTALGSVEAGPYLMPLLDDEDDMVKIVSVRAMGTIKYKNAVDKLIQILITKQGKGPLRETIAGIAAEALGEIGDEKAVGPLISVLLDEKQERFIKHMAAKALSNFKDERVTMALIKVVKEDKSIGYHAAEALAKLGDMQATDAIAEAIKNETDSFAIKKYKEAYKKITGKDYVEQR